MLRKYKDWNKQCVQTLRVLVYLWFSGLLLIMLLCFSLATGWLDWGNSFSYFRAHCILRLTLQEASGMSNSFLKIVYTGSIFGKILVLMTAALVFLWNKFLYHFHTHTNTYLNKQVIKIITNHLEFMWQCRRQNKNKKVKENHLLPSTQLMVIHEMMKEPTHSWEKLRKVVSTPKT